MDCSISDGTSYADLYRPAGVYSGSILKGDKLADLPVRQSTKVELVINLTARQGAGLTVSLSLLAVPTRSSKGASMPPN